MYIFGLKARIHILTPDRYIYRPNSPSIENIYLEEGKKENKSQLEFSYCP